MAAAVEKAIQSSSSISSDSKITVFEQYRSTAAGKSNTEAREIAIGILGQPVDWSWDRKFSPESIILYRLY